MSSIRLYVENDLSAGALVELQRSQAHYLASVMRQKTGNVLSVFNGRDGQWEALINTLDKKSTSLICQNQTLLQTAEANLTLFFAPTKNVSTSYIVQKATELGVSKICPIRTERTIVNKVNVEKLHLVAIEAAEQCERLTIPDVEDIVDLKKCFSGKSFGGKLVICAERGVSENLNRTLGALTGDDAILIGPEGGFSESEFEFLKNLDNALPITMGARIMRADTAVIAALASYQAISGDWK